MKSCAIPPASTPRLFSFSAWRSCASSCACSHSAARRSRRSRITQASPTVRPAASSGADVASTGIGRRRRRRPPPRSTRPRRRRRRGLRAALQLVERVRWHMPPEVPADELAARAAEQSGAGFVDVDDRAVERDDGDRVVDALEERPVAVLEPLEPAELRQLAHDQQDALTAVRGREPLRDDVRVEPVAADAPQPEVRARRAGRRPIRQQRVDTRVARLDDAGAAEPAKRGPVAAEYRAGGRVRVEHLAGGSRDEDGVLHRLEEEAPEGCVRRRRAGALGSTTGRRCALGRRRRPPPQ